MSDETRRCVIEYRETPAEGKPVKFKTVIDSAKDANDARAQFWARQIWPAGSTQSITITEIAWDE